MAAFTTIAAATVTVGSQVAKGIFAGDAAKTAARQAGRFELEKERLQEESIAKLEQNFLDEVRVATDIYDRKLQQDNITGATIIEAAQEGDQRGVAATAGKVKAATDMQTDKTAEKFADQKLNIDLARAQADEKSAEEIAALMDDRAAAAGVKADALNQQADDLSGQATDSFLSAGVSALQFGIGAFGGLGGGKNMQGKAADSLVASGEFADRAEALKSLDGLSRKNLRQVIETGRPYATPVSTLKPKGISTGVSDLLGAVGAGLAGKTATPTATSTGTSTDAEGAGQMINMSSLLQAYAQTPEGKKLLEQQNEDMLSFGQLKDKFENPFGDLTSILGQ